MRNPPHRDRPGQLRFLRRWLRGLLTALAVALPSQASALGFSISEVLFEAVGGENGKQWLELYNGTGATIDLGLYSMGWGRDDYLRGTLQLSGSLAPGATWLVGGPTSSNDNGNPDNGTPQFFDQVHNFDADLRKGNKMDADGIAIFQMAEGLIDVNSVPFYTVLYGKTGAVNTDLLGTDGGIATIDLFADSFVGGESLELSGGSWTVQSVPTPGTLPAAVPEPSTGVLLGTGLAGLTFAGQRRRPRA